MKRVLIVIGSLAVAVAVAAKIMHDRLARHREDVGKTSERLRPPHDLSDRNWTAPERLKTVIR